MKWGIRGPTIEILATGSIQMHIVLESCIKMKRRSEQQISLHDHLRQCLLYYIYKMRRILANPFQNQIMTLQTPSNMASSLCQTQYRYHSNPKMPIRKTTPCNIPRHDHHQFQPLLPRRHARNHQKSRSNFNLPPIANQHLANSWS